MKLKQLSVFLENSPGHLQRICSVLSKANINLQITGENPTKNPEKSHGFPLYFFKKSGIFPF